MTAGRYINSAERRDGSGSGERQQNANVGFRTRKRSSTKQMPAQTQGTNNIKPSSK